jgi:hypothetical protein
MFQRIVNIGRWASIPALLFASLFSSLAGSYALPVEIVIWAGAIFLAARAVRSGDYIWAVVLGVVVIVFSPLLLVDKIFLFMGYTTIATYLALATAFRPLPTAVELS